MKSAAPRCCCSPACPSKNSATRLISFATRCPCSPTACSLASPTSFLLAESCWAESDGSPTAAKKWPRLKAKRTATVTIRAIARTGGHDEVQTHLLEGRIDRAVSCRRIRNLRAFLLWPRRFHQSERPVPLGYLDRLRCPLRRHAGGWRLHPDRGRSHLQHQTLETHCPPHRPHRIPRIRPGL